VKPWGKIWRLLHATYGDKVLVNGDMEIISFDRPPITWDLD